MSVAARRFVGAPLPRFEDERLLRGEGCYVADLKRPGMLHAAFVRSILPHATIVEINSEAALARTGVQAVYTADDLADIGEFPYVDLGGEAIQIMHPVLARRRARYVGQAIAIVVAETPEAAVDAAEHVAVEYDELPLDDRLHDAAPDGVVFRMERGRGDVDAAFASAANIVRSQVAAPRLIAAPIETRAVLAELSDERLTIWLSAQDHHRQLAGLTAVLRLPREMLHVRVPDVGGAFGSKGVPQAETAAVALAALRLRRPVRWVETRTESALAMYQGRGLRIETELAVAANGRFLGLRAHVLADVGAYFYTTTLVSPTMCASLLTGCYAIPAVSVRVTGACSNKVPIGPYRGAGRPEAALAIETAVDTAARDIGFDAVELRRINLVRDFPYDNGLGSTYDSGDYEGALDAAVDLARDVAADGVGIALYVERCGPGYETGSVLIDPDGNVTCLTGSSPHGQGLQTTFAQIVSDELDVSPESIDVRFGDSDAIPDGMGTWGSRSTAAGGSALLLAARDARARLERGERPPLRANATFALPGAIFSFGAYVAGVDLDPVTGEVHVVKVVAVDDCGIVVNPLLAEGQVVGAVAQAVGECLHEYVAYDEYGQPLVINFYDYHLPTAQSVPEIVGVFRETPSPLNPLGAKGVGEGGSVGTPAAVANALAAALGRHVELPFTPSRIWRELQT